MRASRNPVWLLCASIWTDRIARLVLACIATLSAIGTNEARAEIITFSQAGQADAQNDFEFLRTGSGAPGEWTVVADASAHGGFALQQTKADRTDLRFPLAVYKRYSGANVAVEVRFKPVSGAVDQAGGVVVRLQDADNYYIARANALEDNVRFYKVVKGRRLELASANAKVKGGEWHSLQLRAEGGQFTVAFDKRTLISAKDTTIGAAGRVGFWTKADSITRFDKLDIAPLD
jgi:hypothetical protein